MARAMQLNVRKLREGPPGQFRFIQIFTWIGLAVLVAPIFGLAWIGLVKLLQVVT